MNPNGNKNAFRNAKSYVIYCNSVFIVTMCVRVCDRCKCIDAVIIITVLVLWQWNPVDHLIACAVCNFATPNNPGGKTTIYLCDRQGAHRLPGVTGSLCPCCNLDYNYHHYTPRTTKLLGGYTGFTPSVRPSVRLSVRPSVRPSRMPCPLCIIYSYGWILFILGTNDHYHERVCRAPWPLTLTYIFKVIWPWLRKSCPLCSVYSSGWILSIFGTNDHYH